MHRQDESAAGNPFSPSHVVIWFVAAVVVLLAATACSDAPVRLSGFSEEAAEHQATLERRLVGAPNALRLQDHHKFLTQAPPAVGSEANAQNAQYFADQLDEFGFDSIEFHRLELVQPRLREHNLVVAGATLGAWGHGASSKDDAYDALLRVLSPDLADGDVSAELVFANHGSAADYDALGQRRVQVEGRIVLVRASGMIDPNLVKVAARRGAVGMLVYFGDDDASSLTFPTSPSAPNATSMAASSGGLPLLIIPGATANEILSALPGPAVPSDWRYESSTAERLGPSVAPVGMRVSFDRQRLRLIHVVGLLVGEELPDEWVLAGGHRDAEGVGAWQAASGTAIRLESARIIARQVRRGHRPKRTIAVASWDGSTLGRLDFIRWAPRPAVQVVAYLSQAGYAAGPFSAAGSHAFQPLINDIARQVEFPRDDEAVYTRWRDHRMAATDESARGFGSVVDHGGWTDVRMQGLFEEPDQAVFNHHLGIPSVSLTFGSAAAVEIHDDSHEAFKRNGDPKFDTGQQLAELTALFLTRLANAEVPPLDFTATAEVIERGLDQVEVRAKELGVRIRLGAAREGARSFAFNAAALNAAVDEVLARTADEDDASNTLTVALTEGLSGIERGFVSASVVEGQPKGNQLYGRAHLGQSAHPLLPNIHAALEAQNRRQAQQAVDELTAAMTGVVDGIGEVLELAVTPPDSP